MFRNDDIRINKVGLFLQPNDSSVSGSGTEFVLTHGSASATFSETSESTFERIGSLLYQKKPFESVLNNISWTLEMTRIPEPMTIEGTSHLNPEAFDDIFILCHYSVTE